MSTESKAVARKLIEAFATGNTKIIDEIVAPDFKSHTKTMVDAGETRDGLKRQVTMLHTAFPDMKVAEEHVIAEGEYVHVSWKMTGTQKGELAGQAATGKKIEHTGQELLRIRGGKIVERKGQEDTMEFAHKLGLEPHALRG